MPKYKKISEQPIKSQLLKNARVRTKYDAHAAIRHILAQNYSMGAGGMNKCALARRLGCSRSYIGHVTNKPKNLTLDTLSDLATAMGAKVKIEFVKA